MVEEKFHIREEKFQQLMTASAAEASSQMRMQVQATVGEVVQIQSEQSQTNLEAALDDLTQKVNQLQRQLLTTSRHRERERGPCPSFARRSALRRAQPAGSSPRARCAR